MIGGIFLVAGTAIGGGMLALPVLTAPGGFFPAIVIYLLCWLFMAATGLALAEVFLWNKKESNLVTMATMTLGKSGKVIAWILYLFLFYSLSIAYVSGGGNLIADLVEAIWHKKLLHGLGPLLFTLVFAPFVIIGAKVTSRLNLILMMGLILSFLLFVFLGASHVKTALLTRGNFALALLATPVTFTAFAFQGIVPTLTNYLGRDRVKTRRVILLGTALPFIIYIIWEWLILGVIPPEGLHEAFTCGQTAVYPLKHFLAVPWLFAVGECFAFFAIVTSFLGVTLGLLDFLSDGLKIEKKFNGRIALTLLVFIPPLGLAMTTPCLFVNTLQYAGGLGCALLLGLLPLLMAWRGRYMLGFKNETMLGGGRPLLMLLLLFIVFELVVICLKLV